MPSMSSIGIFDSGYGGLTILSEIRSLMPEYNYIYLGDNARTPYGTRSFDVVYRFTLESVRQLFSMGCNLVILACNTASAKALRTIQQNDLPNIDPKKRVLGVIRPTAEVIGSMTKSRHVGLFGTEGTISSLSYNIEIDKLHPDIKVTGQACPMWVPLIEAGEYNKPGADYFVEEYIRAILNKDPQIDTLVLGCTHYPLLQEKIAKAAKDVTIIAQGDLVAKSLKDYLERHPEYREQLSTNGTCTYLTTENANRFSQSASHFLSAPISAEHIDL